MHGNRGSSGKVRRYHCSTRRRGDGCDQPLAHAEPLEAQIVDWLRGFQPDAQMRTVVVATRPGADASERRRLPATRPRRPTGAPGGSLRDGRRDEGRIHPAPPLDPHLDRAETILRDFSKFWDAKPKPAERRKLIASLFDRVWEDAGQIVAVKPRSPSCATSGPPRTWPGVGGTEAGFNSGSDGTRTRERNLKIEIRE
jgi:hypothetical protein